MVKTLERHRYALCEKHVIVPFCCSYQVYRYLAGCFGLISCRHYLVVGYDAVHKQELIAVKEQLEQTECPILGAVLNCVKFDNYLTPRNSFGSVFSQILLPGQKQPPQNNLCGG